MRNMQFEDNYTGTIILSIPVKNLPDTYEGQLLWKKEGWKHLAKKLM